MLRQYQRKTARGMFTKDAMVMAVAANLEGRSLHKATSDFGISYKTLQYYVKLHQKDGNIEEGYLAIAHRRSASSQTSKSKLFWITSLRPLKSTMALLCEKCAT
ncbi:hypothetical protein RRG08_014809 [Elysia crispata]|uniref:HTH psq-type domain-containing protein n=1 Tax=Elysia crispata TaxID=231223 RepID=A0AAE1AH00_9GAST|nr:hypothetical protein RRG08_014809 [Elysia crispata]